MRLRCVECGSEWPGAEVRYRCGCGGTLDVVLDAIPGLNRYLFEPRRGSRELLDRSGVWRYRELLPAIDPRHVVTAPEGGTNLYRHPAVSAWVGAEVALKHEGENPTGSLKDRGMTVGVSTARALGLGAVACASSGNASASMASYAARAGMQAYVFVPAGLPMSSGVAQALAYGARVLEVEGSPDDLPKLVESVCLEDGIYLLDAGNPFRIEGQKSIVFELLDDLGWQVPDWIVAPGGHLGHVSALAKGLAELRAANLVPRTGRLAVVQAAGANPLYTAWRSSQDPWPMRAETVASAIRVGDPVNGRKALRGLRATNGVVEEVTDAEILEAKVAVDRAGIGADSASCAALAGARRLVAAGTIRPNQQVVVVLTGHLLKDLDVVGRLQGEAPGGNLPVRSAATPSAVREGMRAAPR